VAERLPELRVFVRQSESPIGGGSTPEQTLRTWVVELSVPKTSEFEAKLRQGIVPVIARIDGDKIILDMRTVADAEENMLVAAIREAAAN
jgi:L-seryl-tRNA(Ser) seleniumtransferase